MAPSKRNHTPASELIPDPAFDKGMPVNVDAERYTLGSILLGHEKALDLIETLKPEDYSLHAHQLIFARILDIRGRGGLPDRVMVAEELQKHGQLLTVGGLTGLVELDEGLPEIANIAGYFGIVREKSALRQEIYTLQAGLNRAMLGESSAEEIATSVSRSLEEIGTGPDSDGGKSAQQVVEEFRGGISSFLDPSQRKGGLPTGMFKIDEMLGGGIQDGEMVVVAARPSCGKSAWALNVAQNTCLNPNGPQRVDFFSLEMSAASLVTRLMCAHGRVDQHRFRAGYLSKDDRYRMQTALGEIMECPLRIHDDFAKTLPGLIRRMRRAIKEGSKLLILDYVQLATTGNRSESRNQELTEICRTLKLLNLDYGTPIMVLSQIGRSAERRGGAMEPQLGDMKDTGAIEETANVVIALHRPELYSRNREDNKGAAKAFILKNRDGPCGSVNLRFIHAYAQFVSATDDMPLNEDGSPSEEPPPSAPVPPSEW